MNYTSDTILREIPKHSGWKLFIETITLSVTPKFTDAMIKEEMIKQGWMVKCKYGHRYAAKAPHPYDVLRLFFSDDELKKLDDEHWSSPFHLYAGELLDYSHPLREEGFAPKGYYLNREFEKSNEKTR